MEKKLEKIMAVLPQVDCGGCEYGDCAACAKAIAEGAAVNACPACSQEQVDAIAEAVGVETVTVEKLRAYVACIGSKPTAKRNAALGITSCKEAHEYGYGDGICEYGCTGIGDCAEACKFNAIRLEDGVVSVVKELCNGCMACATVCPKNLIRFIPADAMNFVPCASHYEDEKTLEFCPVGCTGCGDCADMCPLNAIEMVDDLPVINYDICVNCMACSVFCSKRIMVDENHDITALKPKIAFVRCGGGSGLKELYEEAGISTCEEAAQHTAIPGACADGCCGLGSCVEVCRHDAISIVNGAAVVDPDKCVGCLACVETCPKKLIVEVPYKDTKLIRCASRDSELKSDAVCKVGCLGCGDCADNCPNNACSVEDNHAVINCELCENCGACTYVCTRDVIVELKAENVWEKLMKIDGELYGAAAERK